MGLFDDLLGQATDNADVENLAAKLGITPDRTEAAIAALAQAHPQPGDTIEAAAAATGLSREVLRQIVDQIGGEGSLAQFASLLKEHGSDQGVLGRLDSLFGKH